MDRGDKERIDRSIPDANRACHFHERDGAFARQPRILPRCCAASARTTAVCRPRMLPSSVASTDAAADPVIPLDSSDPGSRLGPEMLGPADTGPRRR